MRASIVALLVVSCLAACGSSTGRIPLSIDGVWDFAIIESVDCNGLPPGIIGVSAQTFTVSQSGQTVSSQFTDSGTTCTLSGRYAPDSFTGTFTVDVPDGGLTRRIVFEAEGYAREFNGQRQVDGFMRIVSDTAQQCVNGGAVFCAKIRGEGGSNQPPSLLFTEPAEDRVATGSIDIIYVDDDTDVATTTIFADADCNPATTADQIVIAANRPDGNGTVQTVTWDLTGVAAGEYCIFGRTTDGVSTITVEAPGRVTVSVSDSECFDPAELEYAKAIGGAGGEVTRRVASFDDGSFVTAGYFFETTTFGAGEANQVTFTAVEERDAFVARYNADGTLAWARQMGGPHAPGVTDEDDEARGVATFPDGSCVVAGRYNGQITFARGEANEVTLTANAGDDIFVARYNADGSLAWVSEAKGSLTNEGLGVAAFPDGSSIVVGRFNAETTFGQGEPNQRTLSTASDDFDMFAARYNPDGTLAWVTHIDTTGRDRLTDAAAFADGSCVVVGRFEGTATFGEPGATVSVNSNGGRDAFTVRYNADGTVAWARGLGGADDDEGRGVDTLVDGTVIVTGSFRQTMVIGPSFSLTSAGDEDVFLVRYAVDGSVLWARRDGGTGEDVGNDVAAFPDGSFILVAEVEGEPVFGSGDTNELAFVAQSCDTVYAQYDVNGVYQWACRESGPGEDDGEGVAVFDDGSFVLNGSFENTVQFGFGDANPQSLTAVDSFDGFVARYSGAPVGTPLEPPSAFGPSELLAFDRNGEMYRIDPTTFADTLLVNTSYQGNNIGVVSSAIFVPARSTLWLGVGGDVGNCTGCMLSLDIFTGEATLLSDNSSFTSGIPGLALRESDGAIFSAEGDSSEFYGVDTTDGSFSLIGTLVDGGDRGHGMTFVGNTLYIARRTTLVTVNTTNAATSVVAEMTFSGFPTLQTSVTIGSLATTFDGSVYGILKDGGGGGTSRTFLVRVNVQTGLVTNIRQTSNILDGLVAVPEAFIVELGLG